MRESTEDDEVFKIARVRTLTVLPRLDANRKRSVLQFLHESDLINGDKRTINLWEANLTGANLAGANLWLANLTQADLTQADLRQVDLSGANLTGAKVIQEQCEQAKSLKDVTMPDGSKHT